MIAPVTLHPLRWADWTFARWIASLRDVRALSFNQRQPAFWRHLGWMWRHTAGSDVAFIVRSWSGKRIGVTTLHQRYWGKVWIGIALDPDWREKGLGTAAIKLTAAAGHVRYRDAIYAAIKAENVASIQAFLNAGFVGTVPSGSPVRVLYAPLPVGERRAS